jgi:hypothetical protein
MGLLFIIHCLFFIIALWLRVWWAVCVVSWVIVGWLIGSLFAWLDRQANS